jgi:hypothetical protein
MLNKKVRGKEKTKKSNIKNKKAAFLKRAAFDILE